MPEQKPSATLHQLLVAENHQRIAQATFQNGDGGGSNGIMPAVDHEKRIWRLEMAFCAAFVILIGFIGGLYVFVGAKNDALDTRLRSVEISSARIDEKLSAVNDKLDAISEKLDHRQR